MAPGWRPAGTEFSGFVPSRDVLDALTSDGGEPARAVRLGAGAPEDFESYLAFGLDALKGLKEGEFTDGKEITIKGVARSSEEFDKIQRLIANSVPDGARLQIAQIFPPAISPYNWSAKKTETGTVVLDGFVPVSEARRA